jgi:hypothetical protein
MHYLKCNNCGKFNEIKSEYQSFCNTCGIKMANNFPEWRKKHPGGRLDDYLHSVCVTESEIVETPVVIKSNRKGWKYLAAFAIAFAIFYAIGELAGEAIVDFFRSSGTSKEILNKEWTRETYGEYGLTVETPEKLTRSELPIPDRVKQVLDKMDTYSYSRTEGFAIMINCVRYKPEIGAVNLQGAANGSIAEMKTQSGVTNFTYTEDPFTKNDLPGFIQKGSYNKDGTGVEFINTGFANGLVLFQVMVAYQPEDKNGKLAAERVIESIEIDNGKRGNI